MLIKKDLSKQGKTIFKCDRCNKQLTIDNRYGIYIQEYKFTPKKTYDLCDRCYRAFRKGIKKGV